MSLGIDPAPKPSVPVAAQPAALAPAAGGTQPIGAGLGSDQTKVTSPSPPTPPPLMLFTSDVDDVVFARLTPSQKTAYLKLDPKQRMAFSQVFLKLDAEVDKLRKSPGLDWNHLALFERARFEMADMLIDQTLWLKDRDQKSILDRLGAFLTTPLDLPANAKQDPEGYRFTQMAHVITHVYHRTAIHQGTWSTCGGTSAQIDMASNFPAQYVAFALGLLSTSAQGKLPDGRILKRAPDALNGSPGDVRPAISRVVQATFMREANAGDYASKDAAQAMDPFGGGKIHSFVRGESVRFLTDSDLFTWGIDSLTQGVRHELLFEAIEKDLARQKSIGRRFPLVPVTLNWDKGGHQVMVTNLTASRVYVVNPHPNGYADLKAKKDHREGVELFGPKKGIPYVEGPYPGGGPGPVRIYADGAQSFPRQLFDDRMYGAVVDQFTASKLEHLDRFDPIF